ncbi:MAG: phosphate signaling complex protein PhoU [Lachnospiraceae bacterium]|nr:phosphate signaling complex protein PhoU [Lachnospiraceae bacterium]
MRTRFDAQLMTLNRELIEMGALCEEAIALVADALANSDNNVIRKVVPIEEEINEKEHSIESMCLKLLLQQQPVARDLRQISAAMKMITDMKRVGVQATDIAEIISFLDGHTAEDCIEIQEMAKATIKMVTESVDAYVKCDTKLAEIVIQHDDVVDNYFDRVKNRLIEMIAQNLVDGQYALDLLMIAKYFERIGDHAANVAAWVVFSVTGEHVEV